RTVPRCACRGRARAGPRAGRSSPSLLALDRVHAALLARFDFRERGRRVRHELVEHEVVAPALALTHAVDHVVDRLLHHLGRERGHERDLVGHLARGVGEVGAWYHAVDQAVALGLPGGERLRTEEELLGLARPKLPRLDEQLDADTR